MKYMQEWLLDGTRKEYQQTMVGLTEKQFFVEQVCPTPTRKMLRALDSHKSHKFIKALDYVSENSVLFLSFAPYKRLRMLPFDIVVYGLLKLSYTINLHFPKKKTVTAG
jgi:hypothetical protein